jgi:drug/metabolite transporter (DMT)-like permease
VLLKAPLAEVDPVTAQAIRLPIAGLLLGATPWARGLTDALRSAPAGALARLGSLSVLTALSSVMFVAGLKYAGVAVATVLSSTAPLFAIPLGLVFLGERVTRAALAGALVCVAGIVVLQLP